MYFLLLRPQTVRGLVGELVNIRERLTGIINHDWVSVPLVYTQVGLGTSNINLCLGAPKMNLGRSQYL